MLPGSSGVHKMQKETFGGKVDLFSFLFIPSKLFLITLWARLGKGPVFDICEVFSWASHRTFKPHHRLSLTELISSAVIRRLPSFCMYVLVLLAQLKSALVNQHSCTSEASPEDRGTRTWSYLIPISIQFQHCLQSLRLFPWGHRQYIHSMGSACWEVTHQALNRDLLICLNAA